MLDVIKMLSGWRHLFVCRRRSTSCRSDLKFCPQPKPILHDKGPLSRSEFYKIAITKAKWGYSYMLHGIKPPKNYAMASQLLDYKSLTLEALKCDFQF